MAHPPPRTPPWGHRRPTLSPGSPPRTVGLGHLFPPRRHALSSEVPLRGWLGPLGPLPSSPSVLRALSLCCKPGHGSTGQTTARPCPPPPSRPVPRQRLVVTQPSERAGLLGLYSPYTGDTRPPQRLLIPDKEPEHARTRGAHKHTHTGHGHTHLECVHTLGAQGLWGCTSPEGEAVRAAAQKSWTNVGPACVSGKGSPGLAQGLLVVQHLGLGHPKGPRVGSAECKEVAHQGSAPEGGLGPAYGEVACVNISEPGFSPPRPHHPSPRKSPPAEAAAQPPPCLWLQLACVAWP
ncbi:uncharacterized protein LOC125104284 [Lutra lutra]|uniref:uncharacterized protein LOC125104284 n=1 Tax=Lutra lutra TaxID=9657 RepID=UPI001FD4BD9F|nr:uncharacterized protein LOC125104284 [Lutra lutra]